MWSGRAHPLYRPRLLIAGWRALPPGATAAARGLWTLGRILPMSAGWCRPSWASFARYRNRGSLGLESIWWYDWAEPDAGISVFDYSGLWRRRPDGRMVAKPALGALRRTVRALRGR